MKYFSMFSGIGGFELAIQNVLGEQAECVGFSEIDKYAISVYNKHFKHKNYGDATQIDPKKIPDIDLLVGGFPCQAFSIAGKRQGFNDTRGTLFFDIARILEAKKPKFVLLENVKGLVSHDKGRTIQRILEVLSDLGYRVQWQVLNSKDFGVPQNRERIFIVGHLGGQRRPKVFPIPRNTTASLSYIGGIDSIKRWLSGDKNLSRNFSEGQRVYDPEGISKTLNAHGGGLGAKTGLYKVALTEKRTEEAKRIRKENMKKGRDYSPRRAKKLVPREDGLMNTLTAGGNNNRYIAVASNKRKGRAFEEKKIFGTLTRSYHKGIHADGRPAIAVLTPNRESKRQNGRRFKRDGEDSFTLTAQDRHGVFDGEGIRRLTPKECERLQAFPETEKSCIIEVWQNDTKNLKTNKTNVSVETGNGNQVKLVGGVGKTKKQESVKSAVKNTNTKHLQKNRPAQADVLISYGEKGVQIHSQKKLLWSASGAERKKWSPLPIPIEDFVQLLAGINTIQGKEIRLGGEGLHPNEQCLMLHKNGKKPVRLFGKEIMQPAEIVEKDLTTLRKLLKSITSDHSNIKSLEQKLITLSSYVTRAITGFIPTKTKNQNTFTIKIAKREGWTKTGINEKGEEVNMSDNQRYIMLGNAVTVYVIQHIINLLFPRKETMSNEENNLHVTLDISLTPELVEEGFIREIERQIIYSRKKNKYEPNQKIDAEVIVDKTPWGRKIPPRYTRQITEKCNLSKLKIITNGEEFNKKEPSISQVNLSIN